MTDLSLNMLSSSELEAVDPILLLFAMATIPESLSLSKNKFKSIQSKYLIDLVNFGIPGTIDSGQLSIDCKSEELFSSLQLISSTFDAIVLVKGLLQIFIQISLILNNFENFQKILLSSIPRLLSVLIDFYDFKLIQLLVSSRVL